MENGKTEKAFEALVSRQDYLVMEANDLAKAFGKLGLNEHKLVDFCVSFITKESKQDETYMTTMIDVIKHFGWQRTGYYYAEVGKAFKKLDEKTTLIIRKPDRLSLVHLFEKIDFLKNGTIEFKFSREIEPFLFELQGKYFGLHLRELASIRSKYTLILLKLWQAEKDSHGFKSSVTTIKGSLEEWQEWLWGEKRGTATRFGEILKKAIIDLEAKYRVNCTLNTQFNRKKVIGYELIIREYKMVEALNLLTGEFEEEVISE